MMLRVLAGRRRLCDGISRRDFLTIGGLGALGALARPRLSIGATRDEVELSSSFGRAKRCLLLFLTGGPSQLDTWDLKPAVPAEIRGELQPIETNVPGLQISELFPRLARQADKICVVRSVTHGDTVHTTAGYSMLTGVTHPQANSPSATSIKTTPDDFPHLGAVLAKRGAGRSAIPTAVSLPEFIRDAGVNDFPGQDAGFLGKVFSPLLVQAGADKQHFEPPAIVLPPDITARRLDERNYLRRMLGRSLVDAERRIRAIDDHETWHGRALSLLQSPQFRTAFEMDREPVPLREAYGQHLFGRGCLLARRLLEAGVSFVTVYWHYEGPDDSPVWDSHWNHYQHLRERLMPPTDQAVATLLQDLHERGLLADAGPVFGRIRPHAADQQQSGARPLAARAIDRAGRRGHSGRQRLRFLRRARRLPARQPDHSRRPGRDHAAPAGCPARNTTPRSPRPPAERLPRQTCGGADSAVTV